jgi:maltooligosyltrehalose trehalohydrolase
MAAEGAGYFAHAEPGIPEGQRYAYRLDNGPERPDPASLWQPDGIHQPSAVLYPEDFPRHARPWPVPSAEDLVIYELHVGTFTPEGTFDAVIPRLDALRELGVTAVEIMPVAQFPGPRNWGYDGVHLSAPQNTYGGPHGLKRLVDACHARGLAILLDVVYNHLGPEGNYLHEFGPYFTDRMRTPWGPAFNFDGPASDPVRQYVLENVRLWIEDYEFDGLRLDAISAIADTHPRHIVREMKEVADEAAARAGRPAILIGESLRNDVRVVLPPERGGHGLDAEWHDDFHRAVHAHLTGERHGAYVDFGPAEHLPQLLEKTYVLDGRYSRYRGRRWGAPATDVPGDRFVASIQNHDQVGNRARGERLAALVSWPARRLAASLLLLAPHVPMLFMGEEYGEENPFLFFCSFGNGRLIENVRQGRRHDYGLQGEVPDPQAESSFAASRLSWSWPDGSPRAGLRRLYADLLAVRRTWPILRDFCLRSARLLPDARTGPVLEFIRGGGGETDDAVRAYFNLGAEAQPLANGGSAGKCLLWSSEGVRYGGDRRGGQLPGELRGHECLVFGPAGWQQVPWETHVTG